MSWRSREISGRSVAEQWEVEGDGGRSIRLPPTAAVASAAASAAVLNSDAICACTRMLDAALRAVWKGRVGLRVVEGRRADASPFSAHLQRREVISTRALGRLCDGHVSVHLRMKREHLRHGGDGGRSHLRMQREHLRQGGDGGRSSREMAGDRRGGWRGIAAGGGGRYGAR